jgi:hypothetical protein
VKRVTALIASALLTAAAIAGITVTPKDGDYVLHNADNTYPTGYTSTTARFKDRALCEAAVAAGAKAGTLKPGVKCDTSVGFTFAQDCEGEKAPKLYLAQVDIDGKKYWDLPGASFTDDTFVEMAELYVHNATWPAGYPNCWIRGQAPRSEWRKNAVAEPGKVFMERLEPGMTTADLELEEPNDETPAQQSAEFQAEHATVEATAVRQETHVCYEDDPLPCPPLTPVKTACGQQYCGVGTESGS